MPKFNEQGQQVKQSGKKQAPKKASTKKPTDKRKRSMTSGSGRTSLPKRRILKKMMHLSEHLIIRSIIGARIITTVLACGHSTTQRIVKVAQVPITRQPMPTPLRLTPWTVTLTRNDCCTRVEYLLGSGWQSPATPYGCCSRTM